MCIYIYIGVQLNISHPREVFLFPGACSCVVVMKSISSWFLFLGTQVKAWVEETKTQTRDRPTDVVVDQVPHLNCGP